MVILINVLSWIMAGIAAGFVIFFLCACKLGSECDRKMEEAMRVAYICDGRECEGGCNEPECHHTCNIEHAKNFKRVTDGKWMEVEQ